MAAPCRYFFSIAVGMALFGPLIAPHGSSAAAEDEGEEASDEGAPEDVGVPSPLDAPLGVDEETERLFEEARALVPNSPDAGKAAIDAALRAMEKVRKAAPAAAVPHYYVGLLHTYREKWQDARKALGRAVELTPEFYEAHFQLGVVNYRDRKRAEAVVDLLKALDLRPRHRGALYWMIASLMDLGRFEEATPYLTRAQALPHDEELKYFARAHNLATSGPDWSRTFTVESDNYILKTDISQDVCEQMSEQAELIRLVYDKTFPDVPRPERKYVVLLFARREDYLAAGNPEASGGIYQPMSRTLMLHRQETPEVTVHVLKHEGFHQYCHEFLDNIPAWFNEGLGEYFGSSELTLVGGKRAMKIVPLAMRLQPVQAALEGAVGMPSPEALMNMTQQEMYEPQWIHLHYALAWSYVYFAIDGAGGKYRPQVRAYFKALTKGKSAREAYDATFKKLDMRAFEAEWRRFILALDGGKPRRR